MKKKTPIKIIFICLVVVLIVVALLAILIPRDKKGKINLSKNRNNNSTYTKKIVVSESYNYYDILLENYSNYSHITKVEVPKVEGMKHENKIALEIKNKKLKLYNKSEEIEVNLNDETPKYLAYGYDCNKIYKVYTLTEEGNVYLVFDDNNENLKDAKEIYSNGDATEILVRENPYKCEDVYPLVLVDGEIVYANYASDFPITVDIDATKSYKFEEDGTIKYVDGIEYDVLDEEENDIIVKFIFSMNNETYLVDETGILYKVLLSEDGVVARKSELFKSNVSIINIEVDSNDTELSFTFNNSNPVEYTYKEDNTLNIYSDYLFGNNIFGLE